MSGFPITENSPIEHGSDLPDAVDVAIVGGGIIGVMTAYYLAQKGLKAVVLEKGRIAGEQSSRNWGWIRQTGRDFAELPIMIEANQLWQTLADELGEDIGLKQCGLTYLAVQGDEISRYEEWLPHAQAHGVDSRILTADQVAQMLPGASRSYAGALHTPSDMRAEPWVAVPALARAAARKGAVIVEDCAVRGLDLQAGRIAGVITEKGRVAASRVVVAGGSWSALLLRRHGVSIPQISVRATVVATDPVKNVHDGGANGGGLAFRRRTDGGYTLAAAGFHELYLGWDCFRAFRHYLRPMLQEPFARHYLPAAPKGFPDGWGTPRRWALDGPSPFEFMRILDPAPNMRKVREIVSKFETLFPHAGQVAVQASWAGMIDAMPDVVPVVDQVAALPGLSVCTGMCGHGFGIGPAFGRIMADMVCGEDTRHDLSRFRLSRFTDGSRLIMGPDL